MRKPIIGVTVGTPISPKRVEKDIKPVKTINNVNPDENGNVELAPNNIGASPTGHTHTKSEITDFPTSMPMTAHTHTKSEITDFPTTAEQIGAATTTQVSEAKALAANAQSTASQAISAASNAQTTANEAKTAASSAGATASQAMTTATNAQRAAGLAQAAADSKAPLEHTHTKSQITDFPTSMTPTAHTHSVDDVTGAAKLQSPNDMLHNGNEFTFIPAGHSGELYINHRTASGATDGNISNYHFCDGKGGEATLIANYFKGKFQGKDARPIYNNEEVAMLSDVPSKTETWTFTLEDGSTVTKAVYVG